MNQDGLADFMRRNRTSEITMKRYVGFVKSDASARRTGVAVSLEPPICE